MKKYLTTFLMVAFSMPAVADNWIKFTSQAVENAINTLVAPENRQATADEYQKQMDKTTGKISVIGIYRVCAKILFLLSIYQLLYDFGLQIVLLRVFDGHNIACYC